MLNQCRDPIALLVVCSAGLSLSGAAWTARAAEDDLFDLSLEQLEQMVVTAEKRTENLNDVPLDISAFSGKTLIDYGVRDTQSLQIVTPGLVFNNTATAGQPFLRGVGTRFAFAGLEPSVATYIDDRYLARAQATIFELADIERVEVLKGPQGTLYGRNTIGGALRIVTRGVDDELSGRINGTLGNYDLGILSGTVNVPISDVLGARVSALVKKRDGYADNLDPLGNSELDDQDVWTLRTKIRWDLSEQITSQLTLQHYRQKDSAGNDLVDLSPPGLNEGIAAGGISGRDVDHVATAIHQRIDDEESSADLRFDVALASYDLVSITTWHHFKQTAFTDADGTSEPVLDVIQVPQDARAFSQELQLLSGLEGSWQWIAGLWFFDEQADFEVILDVGGPQLASQGDQRAETRAAAVFGQATYAFNDRWSLTLGGRMSYETKHARVRSSSRAGITLPPTPYSDEHDWSRLTPRVTLERHLDFGMLYATYARGFKSGGYNYAASLDNGRVIDPEVLDMFELGWKTTFVDGQLELNGSAYYYDYRDLQVTRTEAGTGVNITQNAADARVFGADLDLRWMPLERLSLSAGLSVLDSEYKSYDAATASVFNAALTGDPTAPGMSATTFDASGEDLLRAPDTSLFLAAEMRFPAGSANVPLVVAYSYTDDYFYDLIADPSSAALRQSGYGLLSARISFVPATERWTVALWGRNLTDEDDYYMDIAANAAGIRGSHGAPLTWGLDVSYQF